MHDTVTTSSATTRTFYPPPHNDLLPPFALSNTSATRQPPWTPEYDSDSEASIENWHLSTPKDIPFYPPIIRGTNPAKSAVSTIMPARTENPSDRAVPNGQRWRFNTNGQLVDAEAGWDLADEIVRLKIGEVTGDPEDLHRPIRTPPKSKLAAATVAQLSEVSPLDSSSNTSVGSSPHASDHPIAISHSRGSSTDTTISSSHESSASHNLLSNGTLKSAPTNEAKERPHSFSGGLSSADLRRLQQAGDDNDIQLQQQQQQQQQQWMQGQYMENAAANAEQLSYPSLTNHVHRPQPQMYDYRTGAQQTHQPPTTEREDYPGQQRNYTGVPPQAPPQFVQGRPNNNLPGMGYRQPPRGFPQQGVVPSPTAMGYPGAHHSSLSLGNTQQLYDMMLPPPPHDAHPAVNRVQQQHNVFRGTHHHSASDPSAIRDAATLALLNNNLQAFPPGMFPPSMPPPAMPMYPNQFYGQDLALAQAMTARLQAQYNNAYGVLPAQAVPGGEGSVSSPTSTNGQNGPSANNRKLGLYKTELCRSWEEKGTCRYGAKCQFAHGEDELRKVSRHPKYKTEICRTFWVSGSCPYGKRCCFIHTELPASGATPASAGTPGGENSAPAQPRPDGRARSLSTNSDPNDASVSLLARISAKRPQEHTGNATPVEMNPNNGGFQFTRPPTGSLRVDTSALDGPSKPQNKSAYPSFASNGILMPAPEHIAAKSPAPVTAGPDLGRHSNSRLEIVGYNNQQQQSMKKNSSAANTNSNIRHSFNGSEVDLNFSPSPPATGHSSYALSPGENTPAPRVNGHVRGGSAGNWGSFGRSSHLASSQYPNTSSPVAEAMASSPWSSTELAMGSSRLHEKAWA